LRLNYTLKRRRWFYWSEKVISIAESFEVSRQFCLTLIR
jgi:hypothetical protein